MVSDLTSEVLTNKPSITSDQTLNTDMASKQGIMEEKVRNVHNLNRSNKRTKSGKKKVGMDFWGPLKDCLPTSEVKC